MYDWMTGQEGEGGAGMRATVFTYTAAMRAALVGNMPDKAYTIWNEAETDPNCEPDCRLATTYIEVAARNGDTDKALKMYYKMRNAHRDSKLAPTVHAFTAAMRAASEGGRWEAALSIWDDMQRAGCKPTGHAFAAVISACSAGGNWKKAVALFDDMLALGIKPDVVSCTALISALGADGQWERCEKVVEWMMRNEIKPNVRTYTALVAALGSGRQWEKALTVVKSMRAKALGPGIEANAYTYSALLKSLGEHGCWEQAEELFSELEREQLDLMKKEASMALNPSTPPPPSQQHARSMSLISSASLASLSSFYSSGAPLPPPLPPPPSSSSSSHIISLEGTAMSAFPGMSKTVPLLLPEGLTTWSPSLSLMAHETEEERNAAYGVVVSSAELVLGHAMASETEASYAELQQLQTSSSRNSDNSTSKGGEDEEDEEKERSGSSAGASTSKVILSSPGATTNNGSRKKASSSSRKDDGFSYFSSTSTHTGTVTATFRGVFDDGTSAPDWAGGTAAMQGLHLDLPVIPPLQVSTSSAGAATSQDIPSTTTKPHIKQLPKGRGPVNEVVCGALMLAYERAGKWKEAVAVLERAKLLGITANTIMINTALSALGKRGQNVAAQALFDTHPLPDAVSYETLVAAHGMAGDVVAAESAFKGMIKAGFVPRDYAYCGLIAAHGMGGDWKAAFKVAESMMDNDEEDDGHDGGGVLGGEEEGVEGSGNSSGTIVAASRRPRKTVHVYNALIAACDRAGQYERAIKLSQEMESYGVEPNNVTKQLLEGVCKEGVRAVESQQAMAAALSAAVAAAGTVLMRVGMF
jgi:pentatricopeptide repeat protein